MEKRLLIRRRKLFGVDVALCTLKSAVESIAAAGDERCGKYVCFCNVHTLMTARGDAAYRQVLCDAYLTFPDGKPLSWLLRRRGYGEADQVAGPDFMKECLSLPGSSHYFYGGTEQALSGLREYIETNCPQARIAGMESPPFRELSAAEEAQAVERMNQSAADYIWIGLGAPKQEAFMRRNAAAADGTMFGVGAAFDFLSGRLKRAPLWLRRLGLEWLYRLLQDPKRLWKRYVLTNTRFLLSLPAYLFWMRRKKHAG